MICFDISYIYPYPTAKKFGIILHIIKCTMAYMLFALDNSIHDMVLIIKKSTKLKTTLSGNHDCIM